MAANFHANNNAILKANQTPERDVCPLAATATCAAGWEKRNDNSDTSHDADKLSQFLFDAITLHSS